MCHRRISGYRFSSTKNNETITESTSVTQANIKWGIHDERHNIDYVDKSSSSSLLTITVIITIVNN